MKRVERGDKRESPQFFEGRGRRGRRVRRSERRVRRRTQIPSPRRRRTVCGARRRDRGMWITWYDLPMEGRDAYFSWLHGTYLPGLLKRPGYLWAAHYASQDLEGGAENAKRYKHVDDPRVGKGYHYMLLIAATDASVFGDPVPSVIHAALPEQGKKMLAMRTGERMNLFTEACRREGRALAAYKEGMTGAPCIQVGSFDCRIGIRGRNARRVCSAADAENVRDPFVRQDAEAEFRCRLGEARNYLRVRVQGRI